MLYHGLLDHGIVEPVCIELYFSIIIQNLNCTVFGIKYVGALCIYSII